MTDGTKYLGLMARKGGAGKTTFAISFACLATVAGMRVAIIDMDPQGSLSEWSADRLEKRKAEEPLVLAVEDGRGLGHCAELCEQHSFDLVIIDTLPGIDPSASAAAQKSDYVVIPCQPGKFDMKAISGTVDLLNATDTPGGIVLNLGRPGSRINETVLSTLKAYNVDICPMPIMKRAAIQDGILDGGTATEHEPNSLAAMELEQVFLWMMGRMAFDRSELRKKLSAARRKK